MKQLLLPDKRMRLLVLSRFSKIWTYLAPIVMKCWAFSGPAVFTFLLVYWVYGGVLALSLLCFAITGKTF